MDAPGAPGPPPASNVTPSDETLEELSEILDTAEEGTQALPPGTMLAPEDEEPIGIVRLLRDGSPRRLYEARQDEDGEWLWLWEATGGSGELLGTEERVLREVRCPMFPRFQASFSLDGRCYLATERCEGETVAELLVAGKLGPRQAVSVLSQVVYALTSLHAAGFVHLGLRPAVIVPGRPTKIVDFSDVTRVGEPPARAFYYAGYSPPELLGGEPADVRSDIYAVGALLFHAVAGKPIAETGVELMAWEPGSPVAGVPQILSRCLGDKLYFPQFPDGPLSKIPGKRGVLPNNAHFGGCRRARGIPPTLENPGKFAVRRQ